MKKVISYSLWGDNPKYTIGAIKNAYLAKQIYPDWICRFYVGQSVPNEILNVLDLSDNVEIIEMPEQGDWTSSFWRFLCADDKDVHVCLSRDTDSRLSFREKTAVDEWLKSDKDFHSIRDHNAHDIPIMAGMWGCRNGILFGITDKINSISKGNYWQVDQQFLTHYIYPIVAQNMYSHDEFYNNRYPNCHPIPITRQGGFNAEGNPVDFIGRPFDHNDYEWNTELKWNPKTVYC